VVARINEPWGSAWGSYMCVAYIGMAHSQGTKGLVIDKAQNPILGLFTNMMTNEIPETEYFMRKSLFSSQF
jgi:hypothetical protein